MRRMKSLFFVGLGAALFLTLVASAAYSVETNYMKVTGSKQGVFKGKVTRNGSNWSSVGEIRPYGIGVETPVDTPRGPGERKYKPIVIRKRVDETSPQFRRAAATNEVLSEVVIQSVRSGSNGEDQVYRTITLKNALVTGVKEIGGNRTNEEEEIQLTFQQIVITDSMGKTTATDDWLAH